MEFSEEEVREKLKDLGYVNVPPDKLREFMYDLQELIDHESTASVTDESRYDTSSVNDTENGFDSSYYDRYESKKPLQQRNGNNSRSSAFSKEKVQSRNHTHSVDKENDSYRDLEASNISSYAEDESHTYHRYKRTEEHPKSGGVRRKVARKKDGCTRIFDETFSETESHTADITAIEERLRNIPMSEQDEKPRSCSAHSSRTQHSVGAESNASLPAFIRSSTSHPHTKRLHKTDPVARYHQFKEEWRNNKVPGESKHSTLRWNVREQMLNYEAFEKPRHRHVANEYVVPTDKKRQALRWKVRTSLARI